MSAVLTRVQELVGDFELPLCSFLHLTETSANLLMCDYLGSEKKKKKYDESFLSL